jgi:uncharacterized protein (DUF305 family)
MKMRLSVTTFALLTLLSAGAFAQTQQQEHQEHHPAGAPAQAQTPPAATAPPAATQAPPAAPAPPAVTQAPPARSPSMQGQMPMGQMPMGQMPMGQMMQGMPEHCRAMMQNMPHGCMQMMMQGRMGGAAPGVQGQVPSQSAAGKAYMEAAERMHAPMMEGLQAGDPDVAFVRGMIAHHQGAIDMAKVVLQYGKDDQTKKWAADVMREQQREIDEMQNWLKKQAR